MRKLTVPDAARLLVLARDPATTPAMMLAAVSEVTSIPIRQRMRLSAEEVLSIRADRRPAPVVAAEHGCGVGMVRAIMYGDSHAHVPWAPGTRPQPPRLHGWPLVTPDGHFPTLREAARHYGRAENTIRNWLYQRRPGFWFEARPEHAAPP